MNTVAKILIVVNLVLAGGFLASASGFLGAKDDWKTTHDQVKADLTRLLDQEKAKVEQRDNQIVALTNQANDAKAELARVKEQLTQFQTQAQLLATELAATSASLNKAANALNEAQTTVRSQQDLINGLQTERNALSDTARTALEQKDSAMRQVNQLQIELENALANNQQKDARIEELNGKLRAAELVAETIGRRFPEAAADLALEQPSLPPGQILDVDNRAGIAVISYGAEDGIRPGHRLTVFRGREYVSTLVVTDTEARQSAGRVVRDLSKSPIQRGDRVMSR